MRGRRRPMPLSRLRQMRGQLWRKRVPLAEIHVPISPTPSFFIQVRLLAASLRQSGGALSDAPVLVTVSRDIEPYDLDAAQCWAGPLGVRWQWLPEDVWAEHWIFGTAMHRFCADFRAPHVLMLDADTVCLGPLDDLARLPAGTLAGCVAHLSPLADLAADYRGEPPATAHAYWTELFAQANLPAPELSLRHSGWPFMDPEPGRRDCPPYFNLGMLAAPAETMRALGAVIFDELEHVDRYVSTGFRCQLALALALARTGTRVTPLSPRWNFPNDPMFWTRFPDDAADVRIMHYLRDDEIARREDVVSTDTVAALALRDNLSPVNVLLRDRFQEALLGGAGD